jgi:hypothetical protein
MKGVLWDWRTGASRRLPMVRGVTTDCLKGELMPQRSRSAWTSCSHSPCLLHPLARQPASHDPQSPPRGRTAHRLAT